MDDLPYTIVIGLEVHVQLLTESKMFCGCGTKFGEPPNTQTCPVCIGLPGSLPVMNRKAYELALRTAVALNCEIPRFTKWDRKSYYYPDLPKGYQISQYDLPMSCRGWLEIAAEEEEAESNSPHPNPLPKGEGTEKAESNSPTPPTAVGERLEDATPARRIGIIRAHLEEDAGKSMHDEGGKGDSPRPTFGRCPPERPGGCSAPMGTVPFSAKGKAPSRIDLNRAGTPLLEIVSEPDLRSPGEAKAYLTELKLLLNYLGVSDCNMQEGSLRVDANINLHVDTPEGRVATPIVEVKNMNSFRAVERALAHEAQRQWSAFQETGHKLGDVPKTTRGWDEASQTTRPQRAKEESSDYRYFPDPDLVPVTVTEAEVEQVRASLGELPAALRARLEQTYDLTPYQSDVLVNQGRALVDYYVELAEACCDGKAASNWVQQDVLRWLGEQQLDVGAYPVRPKELAELIGKVRSGAFETSRGREVLAAMVADGKSLTGAMAGLGIAEVDDSAVVALCHELVAANPKIVAEVREGKLKGLGALIGQAKKRNPNINANRVREECLKLIGEGGGPIQGDRGIIG